MCRLLLVLKPRWAGWKGRVFREELGASTGRALEAGVDADLAPRCEVAVEPGHYWCMFRHGAEDEEGVTDVRGLLLRDWKRAREEKSAPWESVETGAGSCDHSLLIMTS